MPAPAPRPAPEPTTTTTSSGAASSAGSEPARAPAVESGTPVNAKDCKDAGVRVGEAAFSRIADAVRCLVNVQREDVGLQRLAGEEHLTSAALNHARDMAARNFFSHYAPEPAPAGVDPGERIANAGYQWAVFGENLAIGQRTALQVVKEWMGSPSHRAQILNAEVTEVGVGIVTGTDDKVRWAQAFGRPVGTEAPPTTSVAGLSKARNARTGFAAHAARRGRVVVVRGRVPGGSSGARAVRVTVQRGRRAVSRTIRVLPGRSFSVTLRRPGGTRVTRVVVRLLGSSPARLALTLR